MENELVKMAITQGPWALLFVVLLIYVMRENKRREERLLTALEALAPVIEKLNGHVEQIIPLVQHIDEQVAACPERREKART